MNAQTLPLSQTQAYILTGVIILTLIVINTINFFSLRGRLHTLNENLRKQIVELSEEILVRAGYLRKNRNE
jgi:hypothetical protein